jgi:hypothetical protein
VNNIDPTDYAGMDADHARRLKGIVLHEIDIRREALAEFRRKFGDDAVLEAFAEFIGLANSVIQNSHDALELFGIIHGEMEPYEAEKLNLPDIFGALSGVELAKFGCDEACSGCAFRLGSLANQSPSTTSDADWSGHVGEQPFMCHEDLSESGEPTKVCQGWVRLRQHRKAVDRALAA